MTKNIKFFMWITFLLPLETYAGGPAWNVKVTSYQQLSEISAIVKLQPIESAIGDKFEKCNPLVLHIDYKGESWWPLRAKTWSKQVTEERHIEALKFLSEVSKSNSVVFFGYIGTGIVPTSPDSKCEVSTRGIIRDGDNGFIAFHDPV